MMGRPMLIALVALATIAASCSAQRQSPAPASSEYYMQADMRKAEILDLWEQIRGWRVEELQLSANPNRMVVAAVFRSSINRLRICPSQPAPKTPVCTDVCVIKDAICDNAEDICRIASEIPNDHWARDKCNSAKASCKEARERCCSCIAKEPRSTGAGESGVPQLPSPF